MKTKIKHDPNTCIGPMGALAEELDGVFNDGKKGLDRSLGFILMVFPFYAKPKGHISYVSNADRDSVIALLREQLAYFESQPAGQAGHA
jgi:hypothetical protein